MQSTTPGQAAADSPLAHIGQPYWNQQTNQSVTFETIALRHCKVAILWIRGSVNQFFDPSGLGVDAKRRLR